MRMCVEFVCNEQVLFVCVCGIEIGVEQAPLVFFNFFSAFEHVKSLQITDPNNTKNSSLECDFHIINCR